MTRSAIAEAVSRRAALGGMAAGLIAAPAIAARAGEPATSLRFGPPEPFSFGALEARAWRMARAPYRQAPDPFARTLSALDFDAMGQIRYRSEAALWKDAPGKDPVEFFHLGRYARSPVEIHVVDGASARRVNYSRSLFEISSGALAAKLPDAMGFAGFRVMNRDAPGDWMAYLGASYFRSAEPFNQYGLSARGLAIDTATPEPEEFPRFAAFWLSHDTGGNLVVYALLEGDSVAGAYRITHSRSHNALAQDIEARLYFRKPVARLGIAPLTSMYWYGRSDRTPLMDWRPQVHDSDGLAIWTGAGERIWRPLANPPRVVTNAFVDREPRGFGLMQRDRDFGDYQDDGAFYNRRPSAWVEPVGSWGSGSVQLVEIPTDSETQDNIVAFWTPAARPAAGTALNLRYRLFWGDEEPMAVGVAKVVATREGAAGRPGQAPTPSARKFVIDFAGGRLASLGRSSGVEPVVTLSAGAPLAVTAYPVVGTSNWRLMIDAPLAAGTVLNLRAFLRFDGGALTETWVGQAFG